MKLSFSKLYVAMTAVALLAGCTVVSTDPTEAGVLIDKPILFGRGGIRMDDVRAPGTRSYAVFSVNKKYVTVAPQQVAVPFDDYASVDNILLDFNTSIQYRITDPAKIVTFGDNWFKTNIEQQYSEIVRNEVKKYTMKQMMSDSDTAHKLDAEVLRETRTLAAEQKLPIEIKAINIGRAVPNANVLSQMNLTAAAQQRKLTMDQEKLAEDARKEQQIAKANADNAYRTNMNLSPQQYVDLQIAGMQLEACKQAKSCTILPPGTPAVIQ